MDSIIWMRAPEELIRLMPLFIKVKKGVGEMDAKNHSKIRKKTGQG